VIVRRAKDHTIRYGDCQPEPSLTNNPSTFTPSCNRSWSSTELRWNGMQRLALHGSVFVKMH